MPTVQTKRKLIWAVIVIATLIVIAVEVAVMIHDQTFIPLGTFLIVAELVGITIMKQLPNEENVQ